jgi:DNA replication protein DnaC
MEELKNIVKTKNNYNLETNYHKACSDKDFSNYVKTLPIEESLLIKYTSSLEDCVNERKLCRNCPGIKECPQSVKGYVLTPEKNGKRVIFSYVACSRKKEELYKDNVTYFDISRDVRDANLKNVFKDDKGRLPLIKYINDFIKNFDNEEVESKGLYLTGSFGSGKTYMVSAILNEMAKRGVKSTIVYYPEFLRDLKASFSDNYNEKFVVAKKSAHVFATPPVTVPVIAPHLTPSLPPKAAAFRAESKSSVRYPSIISAVTLPITPEERAATSADFADAENITLTAGAVPAVAVDTVTQTSITPVPIATFFSARS